MSLQDVEYIKSRRRWQANLTVSGLGGSRLLNGSNAEYVSAGSHQWLGGGSASAGEGRVVTFSYSGNPPLVEEAADYNADLVAEILRADAAQPETSFNNVVDMLDWLNR